MKYDCETVKELRIPLRPAPYSPSPSEVGNDAEGWNTHGIRNRGMGQVSIEPQDTGNACNSFLQAFPKVLYI